MHFTTRIDEYFSIKCYFMANLKIDVTENRIFGAYHGKSQNLRFSLLVIFSCWRGKTSEALANKYFLCYKQLNTFDHSYHIHKCLDSEPLTFLLVNRYIIFNMYKFAKDIQLHMIMIYTSAWPRTAGLT